MMNSGFQELAQIGVERLVNAIPGGLLIAALAWPLSRIAGKRNSETRFAVWFCALLAIAGLPFMASLTHSGMVTQVVRSAIVIPAAWAVLIFAAWAFIAAVAMTRIVLGLWKLHQLRRDCVALTPASFPAAVYELAAQLQDDRRLVVCSSSAVRVPTAIGFFRPAILIPDWALQELSAEELKVILLHESAHLKRWDDWTNLAQKLVRTIFFFHPAVWWIERRLTIEREMACDDAVLAKTDSPQSYAECLVSLAEKSFARRGLALAQAIVGRARETSLRLARILDGNRTNSSRVFKPALGIAATTAVACLVALSHTPKMISFENTAPAMSASAATSLHSSTQAAVVPVSMKVADELPGTPVRRAPLREHVINRPARFVETAAAAQKKPVPHVLIVRASEQETPPPQMLLLMRTTRYDETGFPILRLSVWRLTFSDESGQVVRQELIVRTL